MRFVPRLRRLLLAPHPTVLEEFRGIEEPLAEKGNMYYFDANITEIARSGSFE